ncbi:tRNA (guanosine(46)-N7)-methyltransferase TrmB [Facilibium subflavum]|uniref:tRNA (guanosine(46)-N7)-methyltransferase TrmB n=1 Tax=Facilibium subflavum TaxID=2219058 RepID=UPI000E650A1A|nr:tRNA (guanosine(46)-N7)-methyltransferase TrmB [Facilibium subflavum]
MNHDKPQHLRTVKSFVKRAGRVTKRQKHALENFAELYTIPYQPSLIDLSQHFPKSQPLIVEIGFGMGDSLVEMAKTLPEKNFIGIEIHEPGIGNILDRIHHDTLTNLKIMTYDAVEVFKRCITNDALDGIQIFFPDPWHKKRHHKRRLVNKDFTELMVSRLKQNGFIHFASDWQEYAEEVLVLFEQNDQLQNKFEGFAPRPETRPLTKFEKRGHALKHGVWDIIFTKKF